MPKDLPGDSEDDADEPGQGLCPELEDASRFASKVKLVSLRTQVAKGRHDWAFAQLGKFQGHAASLDLSCEPMRNLKSRIQQIWTDYINEFPPETVSADVPGATLDSQGCQGATFQTVEIRASNRIENEQEYQLRLAAWGSACETAVNEAVEQYISSMIVLLVCEYDGNAIKQRLQDVRI